MSIKPSRHRFGLSLAWDWQICHRLVSYHRLLVLSSLGHKYLPSAGQAIAANMGLVMGLEIPLPGILQSPGQVPPPSCVLCSLAKEAEPDSGLRTGTGCPASLRDWNSLFLIKLDRNPKFRSLLDLGQSFQVL